jgi:ERCC4-type nuclease
MGLVLNLRKKFNNWVDITLAELCSAYIKQLAKQTSKKRDNSLSTECLQNNLTMGHQSITIVTSSQDTLEKIIMEPTTTEDIVLNTKNWAEERLEKAESIGAKDAIYKEFEEWIEVDEDTQELEIMSLEPLEGYYYDDEKC